MTNLPSIIPDQEEWATMKEISKVLLTTQFLPDSIKSPQQAVAIILKGRELKIPAMQALSQINVIKGKPTMSAELMLAMIYRECPTAEVEFTKYTDTEVECKVRRHSKGNWQTFSWTMKTAQTAGLASGFSWKKYPRAMLRSRVISEMARAVFPDCIMGCSYTPEEMGAAVNDEGEILEVEPKEVKTEYIEPTSEPQEPETANYMGFVPQEAKLAAYLDKLGVEGALSEDIGKKLMSKPFTKDNIDAAIKEALKESLANGN